MKSCGNTDITLSPVDSKLLLIVAKELAKDLTILGDDDDDDRAH